MQTQFRVIAAASLALCLQACVTNKPPAASAPTSYFWLPLLGISDDDGARRTRTLIDAMLEERGYVRGNALALALSLDSERRDDGSLGLGVYAGGYAYYTPGPAPRGSMVVEAFDARTLRSVWRARLAGSVIADEAELHRALDAALGRFSPSGCGRTPTAGSAGCSGAPP